MRFELFKAKNSKGKVYFWWRMNSVNNSVLATSEMYTTKFNAHRIVRLLMGALGEDKCTYKFVDKTKKGK